MKKRLSLLEDMRLGVENTFEYVHTEKDSSVQGAALEPHHTHFILIDNGKSGASAWGGEIEFGLQIQLAYRDLDTQQGADRLNCDSIAQLRSHPLRHASASPRGCTRQPGARSTKRVPL